MPHQMKQNPPMLLIGRGRRRRYGGRRDKAEAHCRKERSRGICGGRHAVRRPPSRLAPQGCHFVATNSVCEGSARTRRVDADFGGVHARRQGHLRLPSLSYVQPRTAFRISGRPPHSRPRSKVGGCWRCLSYADRPLKVMIKSRNTEFVKA